jgi:hypothetical protein
MIDRSEVQNKLPYIYFSNEFCIFNLKLFNIINFKLKIYNFSLNNIIKIFYIIFTGPG